MYQTPSTNLTSSSHLCGWASYVGADGTPLPIGCPALLSGGSGFGAWVAF